jgi:hypothetical protein
MVVIVLLYGCDNLTLLKCHERSTEIKFLRPFAGCTLYGHKTPEETREKLNTYNLNESIMDRRSKWTQQLLGVNDTFSSYCVNIIWLEKEMKVDQGKDGQTSGLYPVAGAAAVDDQNLFSCCIDKGSWSLC